MPDRVVRIPGSDTTWYVDGSNVRHHIPNGGTFLCLTAWKGKQVVELSQDQVNLLSQGDDASCRVDEAANTVIRRTDTGQSWFVDGNLIRHHIPNGGTYGCLIAEGRPLIDGVSPEQVDAIEAGDDATCVPPPQAPSVPDRVVRIPGSDTTWYVDGSNVRHHIPNGGTFLCLTAWKGKQVVELSQDQVNLLSQGDDASCSR